MTRARLDGPSPAPKPKARKAAVGKPVVVALKAPAKVGLPTQLAAIQARYRRAMLEVGDHPNGEQVGLMRDAVTTMLAEKAALGVRDGEETSAGSEDGGGPDTKVGRVKTKPAAVERAG